MACYGDSFTCYFIYMCVCVCNTILAILTHSTELSTTRGDTSCVATYSVPVPQCTLFPSRRIQRFVDALLSKALPTIHVPNRAGYKTYLTLIPLLNQLC
jgi:hypothetical protein